MHNWVLNCHSEQLPYSRRLLFSDDPFSIACIYLTMSCKHIHIYMSYLVQSQSGCFKKYLTEIENEFLALVDDLTINYTVSQKQLYQKLEDSIYLYVL